MNTMLWAAVAILCFVILILCVKLFLMRISAKEIEAQLAERFETETNTLISISSHDPYMQSLAASLNVELKNLRRERHRFQQGDRELKDAITNISHDLRTPLTAIYGYLELLEQEEKTEAVQRYLSMIENRTEVLRQLTEELFRYSIVTSVQETALEEVNLNRALEESLLSFYGTMRQKSITPDIQLPEKPILRLLDPAALGRIFSNIISNALKYSDGDLSVRLKPDGSIVFSNTARTLTPVTAEKLFDRFYTVETGRHSTGLGLSIARLLTERMGGTIRADYKKDKLCILLYFPPDNVSG